jgi:uncharacterized protein YlzI (FlbEa/FlbD family)
MSQNNMIAFITVTDIDGSSIELNPAAILMMQRAINNDMPCTKMTLSFGTVVMVTQTPEEIAQLQMDSLAKVMKSVMETTAQIVNEIDDNLY